MSEKALLIAREKIIFAIQKNYPDTFYSEASDLATNLLDIIDWDNPALMHKDMEWITMFYMRQSARA